jgi:hypothetical protein
MPAQAGIQRKSLPPRLSLDQYDPQTGQVFWPYALLDEGFEAERSAMKQLFCQRTSQDSGRGSKNFSAFASGDSSSARGTRTLAHLLLSGPSTANTSPPPPVPCFPAECRRLECLEHQHFCDGHLKGEAGNGDERMERVESVRGADVFPGRSGGSREPRTRLE